MRLLRNFGNTSRVILAVFLLLPAPKGLSAKGIWAVVATGKLDPRITRQLKALAGHNLAEVRNYASASRAAGRAKLLIELRQEKDLNSFLRALGQHSSTAGQLTPELAREGYILEATYKYPPALERIRITAASTAGFHHGLLRVPQILRTPSRSSSIDLVPPAKFVALTESGRTALGLAADYPSFPERGVVEGFYGTPWSHQDRLDILRFEGQHDMNVYYYAPKEDLYHRKLWREPYPPKKMKRLAELVNTARENFVDFCFAISPGLSMAYSSDEDFSRLTSKLESVRKLGVSCFGLFLDDVPPELENPLDRTRFKTLAEAHVYLVNRLHHYLKSRSPGSRLVLTPTTYTNEWGSRDYLRELGEGADQDVAMVWTGPKVISPALTVAEAEGWGKLLRRPPLVWDNFPVNDGIAWRLNLGPDIGRDANLPQAVHGLFSNPMNQAHVSMIPLQTVADYLWNAPAYDPQRSLRQALIDQYGKDSPELLANFLKAYGDYWWDENVFRPLFVEERAPIDTSRIEQDLAQLDSSLESMRHRSRFQKLVPELSPFPSGTRKRLELLSGTPSFRRLPDGKLEWRDDYDVLHAPRLAVAATIDGDFAKWQSGSLYVLDKAEQIVAGARHWHSPDQFSSRVALGWDDDSLYVGVDVTDGEPYQPFSGRGIEQGDVFILTLETAYDKNFTLTEADGDEYRLLFSPGNFSGVEPSVFSDEDYLPPRPQPRDYNREIKTAWKKTPTGFSGDIAIPSSWFEGGKLQTGYQIGLSFAAQKALPPVRPGRVEEVERIVFTSKSDRLFPVRFSNPSSYQRLVLVDHGG